MKMIRKVFVLILIFSLLLSSFSLVGCASKKTYTVNFYTEDKLFLSYMVKEGSAISEIEAPDTETKYFRYWTYKDGKKYDFGIWEKKGVTSDVNLYAYYEFDEKLATNSIESSHLSPHLKVINNTNFKDKFLWFEYDNSVSGHGSAVIYDSEDGYYYALTNARVILVNEKIAEQAIDPDFFDISVVDYNDEEISAEVVFYSADYDLAIIRFESSETYEIIEMADENPEIGDHCIAVGNPSTVRNKITFGVGESYELVELANSKLISNVNVNVYKHSAATKNGSYGGALLNDKLELIGINYAEKKLLGIISVDSFALPISNVKEFISLYDPA